jgi:hypothetical protein
MLGRVFHLLSASVVLGALASSQEIVVEDNAALRETSYKIVAGDCTITWITDDTELNREVITSRSDCVSLAEQAPLIAKLLRKVLEARGNARPFRTLYWGRLFPDGSRDTTMSRRLVLAAEHSPQWDSARGRPRDDDVNGAVQTLANDADIFAELRTVFAEAGLELRLSSVEKVLVLPAGKLPFFAALRDSGVRASDKLPWDCLSYFSVQPVGTNKP